MVEGYHNFKSGEIIHLNFTLNNKQKTAVSYPATIINIEKQKVGCQFLTSEIPQFNAPLGFFVMPDY